MKELNRILLLVTLICLIVTSVTLRLQPTASDEEVFNMIQNTQSGDDNVSPKDEMPVVFRCLHIETTQDITPSTCSVAGTEKTYCKKCNELLCNIELELEQHDFETKTIEPTCYKKGMVYDVCTKCDKSVEVRELEKTNHTAKEVVTKKRTCTINGELKTYCTVCNVTIKTMVHPATNHQWIDSSIKKPTPFEEGYTIYRCANKGCAETKTETTTFVPNGKTNLYIPTISFNKAITLAECNQSNTDKYDICCDVDFIAGDNPLFFGHNTRSLSTLYKVKVGDIIYFTIDGKVLTYKVTISEKAYTINDSTDIKGFYSNTKFIYNDMNHTIRLYTCYSDVITNANRWIVIAEKL